MSLFSETFKGKTRTYGYNPKPSSLEVTNTGLLQQNANNAGLNENDKIAIQIAQDIINGKYNTDITKDPYYLAQKEQAQYATDSGLQRLRRTAQLTGMEGSTGAADAEAQYINDVQFGLNSVLSDLQQKELERTGPLAKIGANQFANDIELGSMQNQNNIYNALLANSIDNRRQVGFVNTPSFNAQLTPMVNATAGGISAMKNNGSAQPQTTTNNAGTAMPKTSNVPNSSLMSAYQQMYNNKYGG